MLVYKATNTISGKAYVGLTETTLAKRRARHYWDAKTKNTNRKFLNALNKYSPASWEWDILRECETVEELNDYEIAFIAQYDTFHNGYNSTTGGFWHMTDRKINDLPGIKLAALKVGGETRRSQSYKDNMSNAKKEFYQTEEGLELRQQKSEKMVEFWNSPEGQEQKKILSQKCGRPQQTKLTDEQKKEAFDKWEEGQSLNSLSKEYGVARPTLKRYFKTDSD